MFFPPSVGNGAVSQVPGTPRLDHCACSLGGDLQMASAALGGRKPGGHLVPGLQGLILTVLSNAVSWFSPGSRL